MRHRDERTKLETVKSCSSRIKQFTPPPNYTDQSLYSSGVNLLYYANEIVVSSLVVKENLSRIANNIQKHGYKNFCKLFYCICQNRKSPV